MPPTLEPIGDRSSIPERIYERLLKGIVEGEFSDGKLPPEIELADKLGVSRTALREALQKLELESYIVRRRQVGTLIVANRPKMMGGLEKLNSVTGIITDAGMEPGTTDRKLRFEESNSLVAQHLDIKVGTKVAVLERVRTANGISFCYDVSFILPKYFQESDLNKMGESLFTFLSKEKGQVISNAIAYIHPYAADNVLVEKLSVSKSHLLILLEQIHFTATQALWYSRAFYRSDLIGFHVMRSL